MDPSFLIVIVLYNSGEWIGPCLEAIRRARYSNLRTVVIDNASSDDAIEYVAQSYPWAYAVRSRYNRGFAGGNNYGVEEGGESDFILLLNPDTEVDPDLFRHLVEAFKRNPGLGVAGCKMLDSDNATIQHVGGMIRPNGLSYHLGEGERDIGQYRGLIHCDYVQGAGLAIRRNLWNELHGFDEGFFPAYFEEADLCRRARGLGWEVAVVCEATLIHHQDVKTQVRSVSFLRMLFRGRARYLMKHNSVSDWLLRYVPAELRWLLSRASKGYRRIALKSFWDVWAGGS